MATKGFEEEQVLKLRLHDMRIGEELSVAGYEVLRVPGGWLYFLVGFNRQPNVGIFVPRPLTTMECW